VCWKCSRSTPAQLARERYHSSPEIQRAEIARARKNMRVLQARGERIHAMSRTLACESLHIEDESREHDLHAFQGYRRMDEILVANFLVFHDAVKDAHYDVWIADEAWDIDYFLHRHPDLKTAPYVWLTDFVGWLPMRPTKRG
jgi:hypothetical protein